MHLVSKTIKGREYFYLVEKQRQGSRVVTSRTVYVGDRQKLAALVQQSVSDLVPSSFVSQPVGAALALATVAQDLGIESLIDNICPVRDGATPTGRRLVIAAICRALMPRSSNGMRNLKAFYESSVLTELLPVDGACLDDRRMYEVLDRLERVHVDQIEASVVRRLIDVEQVDTTALAFDATNFDSYVGARTPSGLLRRGHSKSGRPLRVLGLGLLVTQDDGMPLLSFTYPGNDNDIKSFGRFLSALDRRRDLLITPMQTTIAADGGNISGKLLSRMEIANRYYVMRLPSRHLTDVHRCKRSELPALEGTFQGKVWAKKFECYVYRQPRCVVDVYSKRMHNRQLPGIRRDQARARRDLRELQRLLIAQQKGLRRAKPITTQSLQARVTKTLSREHMAGLFDVTLGEQDGTPTLTFREPKEAWRHLEDHVLGRSLLVTNRLDWEPEKIVQASRVQSHNERFFRDAKDPEGVSMLPLRHRRDTALRAHALIVMLGLILAKVLQRRVKKHGIAAPTIVSVLGPLKEVTRARIQYPESAAPALRALAEDNWIPSKRTTRQEEILFALSLSNRTELGTTLEHKLSPKKAGRPKKTSP